MFDISFFEILIISMIALIVVGPERLPQVARTLGHLIGRCRQFVYSVKTDIHNEIRMEELKEMQHDVQDTMQSIENSVRQEANEIQSMTEIKTEQNTADTSSPTPALHVKNTAPPESTDARQPASNNDQSKP